MEEFQIRMNEKTWPFSSPEGRFEIGSFLPGTRPSIEVTADGYSMDSYSCIVRKPADSPEVEIRLHRGTLFRGMLIDGRTGGALAGAPLIAGLFPPGSFEWGELNSYNNWRGPLRVVRRLKTDATGVFEFREVG